MTCRSQLRESAGSASGAETEEREAETPTPTHEVPLYHDAAYAYQRRQLAQPTVPSSVGPILNLSSTSSDLTAKDQSIQKLM